MNLAQGLGFGFLAVAGGCALRMWWLNRQLKQFREPSRWTISYIVFPYQRRFYKPEGQPLVTAMGRIMIAMYSAALFSMIWFGVGAK